MVPDRGGPALPEAPVCGARDYLQAKLYVETLTRALDQDGWSRNQRKVIRQKLQSWRMKAAGMDEFFNRRGNIPGNPDGPPPTTQEIITTRWRREHAAKARDRAKALSAKEKLKAEEVQQDKEGQN